MRDRHACPLEILRQDYKRQRPRYQWEDNAKIYLTESVEILVELF